MRNMKSGLSNAEYMKRNMKCGICNMKCGICNSEHDVRNTKCGMDYECGTKNVEHKGGI